MRSRSVSRRSVPSSSAVEGSLSRMRSRSAHREQDRHSWVSLTELDLSKIPLLSLFFMLIIGSELLDNFLFARWRQAGNTMCSAT